MKYILLHTILVLFSFSTLAQEGANNTSKSNDNELYYFSNDSLKSINDTVKNKKGNQLKEVIVTANKHQKPITALRSGLKPMDTPQSVQVIESEVIEQQQSIRLSEVLKNANGVYVGSTRGGATESFFSRGYDMSTNNMFKNGFRYNAGSIPEVSSLDKVEFLKGGSALLYGNVAPGGILNLVTKTPSFKRGGEVSMQMGSYAYYKPTIDFYGPLNKHIAYRITGSYENSESFRDVVKNERLYINPSLLFNISDKTQITVQGDYLKAYWTPDFGTGVIAKEILDVPSRNYYGALWSNGETKSASASVLLNHSFNNNWKLNFNSSFQSYDRESKGTERMQILPATLPYGTWSRPLGQNKNIEKIVGDQLSLQGNFNTGSIKHQLFAGADWENSFATAYTYVFAPANYDTVNIFTFDPATQRIDEPNSKNTRIVYTDTNRFGIYAQDLISFTEQIKVLAGIRWSWQEAQADTHDLTKSPKTITEGSKKLDNAFSPKIGLVYQPTKDMSVFASYSNSFTPNTGTTVDLEPIKPSIIDQYEVGVKKDFWRGVLSTNVTVYQITNSNLAQTAEFKADGSNNTDTNIKTLSGETKSKGIEVDITARPVDGLSIVAGYSYNDMRYSKTSGLNGSFIEGDRLVRTPSNTANLSFFYTLPSGILKGMSFGAIGNYIGDRFGGWNDQIVINSTTNVQTINDRDIPLKGYTTIDLSAGYTWKKISILCKLSNIADELNYTVHENYSVNPIAPRQFMTSLKYKF
jgi:iron complex outermembrane receptor protein